MNLLWGRWEAAISEMDQTSMKYLYWVCVCVSRMCAPLAQSLDILWAPWFSDGGAMCPLIAVLGCK